LVTTAFFLNANFRIKKEKPLNKKEGIVGLSILKSESFPFFDREYLMEAIIK